MKILFSQKNNNIIFIAFIQFVFQPIFAQKDSSTYTLNDLIKIGNEKSLDAFRAQNMYLASFYQYKNYNAQKLPTLNLNTSPITQSRSVDVVYSVQDSGNIVVERQSLNSSVNLSANQNLTLTGGSFYIDSELGRLETILPENRLQYTTTPIRMGLQQPLFAYNRFKWQRKIEPLQFEIAKRIYITASEDIALTITTLFFNLILAEKRLNMEKTNMANADTLYSMGKKRFEIASIEKTELLTLELDLVNSQNQVTVAENTYDRALSRLTSFFGFHPENKIRLLFPDSIPDLVINENKALEIANANSPSFLDLTLQGLNAESLVEQARRERLTANLNLSYGLNNAKPTLGEAYRNLNQQQRLALALQVPIVDWGLQRGRSKLAEKRLEVTKLTLQQNKIDLEQNIRMTVREFNLQKKQIRSAQVAQLIANEAYDMAKKRFMLGRGDVNSMSLQLNRQVNAAINYIQVLQQYWNLYFTARRLTLFDFEKNISLSQDFDTIISAE